jgi:hypothetical protein
VKNFLVLNIELLEALDVHVEGRFHTVELEEVDLRQVVLSVEKLGRVLKELTWVAADDGVLVKADIASVWVGVEMAHLCGIRMLGVLNVLEHIVECIDGERR